jgi:hypothetical protein
VTRVTHPHLDSAQFAVDSLCRTWEELSAKMKPLAITCHEGRGTVDQISELEEIKGHVEALIKDQVAELITKIEKIGKRTR